MRRLLRELEQQYPPFNRTPLRLEDLEVIADHEGLLIFRQPIPCLSCLCSCKGRSFILVKQGLSPFLEAFLLGHELGHHFFHPGLDLSLLKRTLFSRGKIEQEANAFALCAILPTPALEQMIREKGYPSRSAFQGYLQEQYGDITFYVEGKDMLESLIRERVAINVLTHSLAVVRQR
jgi:Zn-dependent peptidase ImmA (M78 family)